MSPQFILDETGFDIVDENRLEASNLHSGFPRFGIQSEKVVEVYLASPNYSKTVLIRKMMKRKWDADSRG